MKNFNFKINNFYSIFNQMSEGNQNIDSLLDDKLKHLLQSHTSPDFTYEMMKRIDLEKEFAKEDVKTYRIAKYIIGGFISLLVAFVMMFTFVLNTNEDSKDAGFFNGIIDSFSIMIQSVSVMMTENLGFAFDFQTGLIILLVMVCLFLFSFADRIIFKKGYK
ncbi:MAG: hypothetical protein M3R36_07830 [Bacteroidota bacterium]|nr:hypothetical protein [Bacteroidota bacterium]